MIQRSDREVNTCDDAWGARTWRYEQLFEIEEKDVGTDRPNYLGHKHRTQTFTRSDVGRQIQVLTDNSDWTCWSFMT